MGEGRVGQIAPAGIFDGHPDAELDGSIADELRRGDAADPHELDRDPIGHAEPVRFEQRRQRDDVLIHHHRPCPRIAEAGTVQQGGARLLQEHAGAVGTKRAYESSCRREREAAVGIGKDDHVGPRHLSDGKHPGGIDDRIIAHLHLQPLVPLADPLVGLGDHRFNRGTLDRPVERCRLGSVAAESLP